MKFDIKSKYNNCIPPTLIQENNEEDCHITPISIEDSYTISKKLLMATNSTDYNNVVSSLNELMHSKLFLSYYLMTKHRPKLENSMVEFLPQYKYLLMEKAMELRMVEHSENANDFSGKKNKVKSRYYSKIKGRFGVNYNLLVKKISSYNLNIDCSSLIIFDSFDGANHLETVKGKIDLVSFNLSLINSNLLTKLKGYSTSRSSGILTWMQVSAKEEPCMILSMLHSYYSNRTRFIENQKEVGVNIYSFDIYDGKMLYGLT